MATKEVIFIPIPGSSFSERELHFTLDDDNRVEWQVVPAGEHGRSRPFEDFKEANRFAGDYAVTMGFTRLENTNSKPVEAVKMIDKIIKTVEADEEYQKLTIAS